MPDAVGKTLTVGGKPRTIVGVMPKSFEFPDRDARLWLPMDVPEPIRHESRKGNVHSISVRIWFMNALARLKSGVTPGQAASEAAARAANSSPGFQNIIDRMVRRGSGPLVTLTPLNEWVIKDVKPALWLLSAAIALLFVAAIGNVANMQLGRAAMRRRDVMIRSAVGARSGRLARQLFVERSLLAAIGGALGLWLTAGLMRVLPALLPEDVPRLGSVSIDGRALLTVTALTLLVSVAINLLPARLARRVRITNALMEDGSAPVGQSLRSPAARARALIAVFQVAIAALLLVGAALLAQTFLKLRQSDRGYEPANLLTARITYADRNAPADTRRIFFRDVLDRLAARRGVAYAGLTNALPLTAVPTIEPRSDEATSPSERLRASAYVVSPNYLPAMGMRVTRGRGFNDRDVVASYHVILVNESFANRYLSGDPLAATLNLDLDDRPLPPRSRKKETSGHETPWRIVGVVADVTREPGAPTQPEIYGTLPQFVSPPAFTQYVVVRTTGDRPRWRPISARSSVATARTPSSMRS